MVEEVKWQQCFTYELEKAPAFGFGIAISGGVDNPSFRTGDTSIIITDIVRGGPAYKKLQVNDILIAVNGTVMENVSHSEAVATVKRSGRRAKFTVKRNCSAVYCTPFTNKRKLD